jgi:hypothetical protein
MSATMKEASWLERRFEPIDNANLVVFRALYGLILVIETAGAIGTGWVTRAFVEPTVRFPMIGFEWVPMPPGAGMYAYFGTMAALAALIMIGLAFRAAIVGCLVLWCGAYVTQTAHYNNHYYLIALLCLLLATTPAANDFSVRVRLQPSLRSTTCPRWCRDILVWQIAILYGFAAYAKLSPDWLSAKPLEVWLGHMARTRTLGTIYAEPWLPWLLAWGGLAFDALVVPGLLWRRTRWLAFGLAIVFHLFNSITFRVGVFPYLGIALCIFFFPPEDIRARILRPACSTDATSRTGGGIGRRIGVAAFAVYFALQLLLPLRHHLYPGSVDWHEEGYRMSWRMMLRAKTGRVMFRVRNPVTGTSWRVDPRESLTDHQAARIAGRPDMIWLFAQHLRDDFARRGESSVQVYADALVSLNGGPRALLIDSSVDLASTPWRFVRYNDFVTPFPEPPRVPARGMRPAR